MTLSGGDDGLGVRVETPRSEVGEDVLTLVVNWLLRALMAIAGLVLVYQGWPVARGAWQAQKADAVVRELRNGEPMNLAEVTFGIDALSRAVAANPTAGRYLLRSELEGGAALTPELRSNNTQLLNWLHDARSDLEVGLRAAPARSIDWLRLAAVRQTLDGPSREVIALLQMSIRTGPWIAPVWPTRLRLILDNWAYFSDEQMPKIQEYVLAMWRHSADRRFFAWTIRDPVDELIIRSTLREEPGAQEELTRWILQYRKK